MIVVLRDFGTISKSLDLIYKRCCEGINQRCSMETSNWSFSLELKKPVIDVSQKPVIDVFKLSRVSC